MLKHYPSYQNKTFAICKILYARLPKISNYINIYTQTKTIRFCYSIGRGSALTDGGELNLNRKKTQKRELFS